MSLCRDRYLFSIIGRWREECVEVVYYLAVWIVVIVEI